MAQGFPQNRVCFHIPERAPLALGQRLPTKNSMACFHLCRRTRRNERKRGHSQVCMSENHSWCATHAQMHTLDAASLLTFGCKHYVYRVRCLARRLCFLAPLHRPLALAPWRHPLGRSKLGRFSHCTAKAIRTARSRSASRVVDAVWVPSSARWETW